MKQAPCCLLQTEWYSARTPGRISSPQSCVFGQRYQSCHRCQSCWNQNTSPKVDPLFNKEITPSTSIWLNTICMATHPSPKIEVPTTLDTKTSAFWGILIFIFVGHSFWTLNRNLLMIMNMILSQEAITEVNENYTAATGRVPVVGWKLKNEAE